MPLILGLVGLIAFMLYESKVPKRPIVSCCTRYPLYMFKLIARKVSIALLSTRTGLSGYIQTFTVTIILLSLICTASISGIMFQDVF